MIKRILEILLIYLPATFLVLSISLVLLYKWVPVRWTPLMLIRTVENHCNKEYRNIQDWVKITDVAPNLIEAVRISEDSRFYSHSGFDVKEIQKMRYNHMAKGMKYEAVVPYHNRLPRTVSHFAQDLFQGN